MYIYFILIFFFYQGILLCYEICDLISFFSKFYCFFMCHICALMLIEKLFWFQFFIITLNLFPILLLFFGKIFKTIFILFYFMFLIFFHSAPFSFLFLWKSSLIFRFKLNLLCLVSPINIYYFFSYYILSII